MITFKMKNKRMTENHSEIISNNGKYVLVMKNNSIFVARTHDNKIIRKSFKVEEEV